MKRKIDNEVKVWTTSALELENYIEELRILFVKNYLAVLPRRTVNFNDMVDVDFIDIYNCILATQQEKQNEEIDLIKENITRRD